jgi:hypothetical protein
VPWPDAVSYIRHSHCTGYGLWGKISVVRPSSSPETARGARDGQARRCHARCLGHPGEGDVRAQPGSRVQGSAPGYRPRRRQTQSLYWVVSDHLETLLAEPVAHGAPPYPRHIERKFRRFLTCGIRAQRYSPSFVSWRSQSAEQREISCEAHIDEARGVVEHLQLQGFDSFIPLLCGTPRAAIPNSLTPTPRPRSTGLAAWTPGSSCSAPANSWTQGSRLC